MFTITDEYRLVQTALDVSISVTPDPVRPVLVTRNGDQLPVRPVAPVATFKRLAGQPEARFPSEERSLDQAVRDEAPTTAIALVRGAIAAPVPSSLFLAQHIAQEDLDAAQPNKAENEASVAAYSTAAERGTVFYGLEYPVDFSV